MVLWSTVACRTADFSKSLLLDALLVLDAWQVTNIEIEDWDASMES